MKMSNNPAKYEVLIKQYLHSILDISVQFDFLKDFFLAVRQDWYSCENTPAI